MLPGPDRIVACPHCRGLSSHGTLASGNTRVQRRESEKATCPKCGEPLRTPFARQCRFCGADWH